MFSSHCTHTLHPIVLRLLPLLFCQRKKKCIWKQAIADQVTTPNTDPILFTADILTCQSWKNTGGTYITTTMMTAFHLGELFPEIWFCSCWHGVLVPWTEWGYCYRCWTHLYFSCFHMSMGFVVYPNDPHNCFLVTLDPFRQNINVLLKMNPLGVGQ